MSVIRPIFILVLAIAAFWFVPQASAQLEIDITEGTVDPVPVAVPDFLGASSEDKRIGAELANVVRNDLERSGLFKSLNPSSFIETQSNIDYEPIFADWRVIRAQVLITGRIISEAAGRKRVEFRVWDVYQENQILGQRFRASEDNWRRVAHKVADAVYEKLTGETGYFDTRIVFVHESGPKTNRRKKLAIIDQDGANPKFLQTGADIVLTPRYSPNTQTITYMSYESRVPQIYLLNIETGNRELLGKFPGMTFSPRFAPDGQSMILSLIRRGNSDIYLMNMSNRSTKRLTSSPAIDVSGSFSPDGRRIAFNSDRGGSPQIYTMKADGSEVKRISFGDGRYSAPVWSPRGDKIAFVKSLNGRFSIGVMNPDGSGERTLTESYLDESPTWAPNGRVILFSRETRGANGTTSIWSVDLTGRNLRKVETPGQASDPAWSPVLP
jgi:TolB protein